MFVIGCNLYICDFGLEKIGVELDEGGVIKVSVDSWINVELIYVVGDVINRVNLIFVVICEGYVFVDIVFGGIFWVVGYSLIVMVVFL